MSGDNRRFSCIVPPEAAGQRLDFFLSHGTTDLSRSYVQKLIKEGSVLVNGHTVIKRQLIAAGDGIEMIVTGTAEGPDSPEPQNIPLPALYEDEHLLAIDKPAGLVVHPGHGNRTGTVVNALLYRIPDLPKGSSLDRPGIVHRLDKNTSGVLLVAKTPASHAALARAFATRTVKKNYLGFCLGMPPAVQGTIDIPIGKSRTDPMKYAPHADGKSSLTEYRMLSFKSGISLVRFMPHTGRTHQIRVHCSCNGFPIVADTLYGGGMERLNQITPCDRPFAQSVLKCFKRHALHARGITFRHPVTGNEMTVEAPLPADFGEALRLMGDVEIIP